MIPHFTEIAKKNSRFKLNGRKRFIHAEEDKKMFLFSDPGGRYRTERDIRDVESSLALAVLMGDRSFYPRLAKRAREILDAHAEDTRAREAIKQSPGYRHAEAEFDAANRAEFVLRRKVAETRPQTIAGLLAKLNAIAEAFGRETIDEETKLEEGKAPQYDVLALFVMRDALDVLGAEARA